MKTISINGHDPFSIVAMVMGDFPTGRTPNESESDRERRRREEGADTEQPHRNDPATGSRGEHPTNRQREEDRQRQEEERRRRDI